MTCISRSAARRRISTKDRHRASGRADRAGSIAQRSSPMRAHRNMAAQKYLSSLYARAIYILQVERVKRMGKNRMIKWQVLAASHRGAKYSPAWPMVIFYQYKLSICPAKKHQYGNNGIINVKKMTSCCVAASFTHHRVCLQREVAAYIAGA